MSIADGSLIGSVQWKVREDFSQTVQPRNWIYPKGIGAGMAVDWSTQPSGLRITTGTTPSSETVVRLDQPFENPVRAMFYAYGAAFLSQRIANQEFELRLVSADGTEYVSWLFDGTVATSAKQRSANQGVAAADGAITGTPDTLTGSPVFELECWIDETYWHTRTADSTAVRGGSWVRQRRVPDPRTPLYVEIVARNLATAPASSTTLTIDGVTVQDISELSVEVTGGRGSGALSQVLPVTLLGSPGVNTNGSEVSARNVSAATDPVTSTALTASQTFTQTSVDLTTNTALRGTRHRILVMMNSTVFQPGTVILEESTDGTTFRESWRSPVPIDGAYHSFDVPQHLRYYRWKLVNNSSTAMTGTYLSDELVRGEGISFDLDKLLAFPLSAAAGGALAAAGTSNYVFDLGWNHNWETLRWLVYDDQAATVFVDESIDGTTWRTVGAGTAVAAATAVSSESQIRTRFLRLRILQGATAATALTVSAALKSL